MADPIRITQAGVTVLSGAQLTPVRITQAGVTVLSTIEPLGGWIDPISKSNIITAPVRRISRKETTNEPRALP